MDTHTAPDYIRQNFEPDDRMAVVLIGKGRKPEQRIESAERIAGEPYQGWLHWRNKIRFEIYIGMNTLRPDATHRRKEDIAEIRHVYLDFDHNGTEAVRAMRARPDMPTPNHIIESSPGRYQTIWRVEGFELDQAEQLMRGMVRALGADPAAVDASRVLRMPALFNHKYRPAAFVRLETLTDEIYRPRHFPSFAVEEFYGRAHDPVRRSQGRSPGASLTQSERDWAHVKRALAAGTDPGQLIRRAGVATFRQAQPSLLRPIDGFKSTARTEEERPTPNQ